MSHLVPVREYASAAEMMAAYKARLRPKTPIVDRRVIYALPSQVEAAPAAPAVRSAPIALPQKRRDWLNLAPGVVWKQAASKQIIEAVCRATGVARYDLHGECRVSPVVTARHIAFWLMRTHTSLSLPQIGRTLGDRDHTTVMNGVRRVDERLKTDDELKALVDGLSRQIMASAQ